MVGNEASSSNDKNSGRMLRWELPQGNARSVETAGMHRVGSLSFFIIPCLSDSQGPAIGS